MSPIYTFTLTLLVVAGLLALLRGGPWERAVWAILALAWVVSTFAPFDYRSPAWGAIGADIFVFLFLLYGALRTRMMWLPIAGGFQFLVLATHFVFATNDGLRQWAYISAYYVWNIALIGTLCAASLLKNQKRPL